MLADLIPCGSEFFKYLSKQHPSFPSSYTPLYSDIAFQILGYAIESITKKPFAQSFDDAIVKALSLKHTSYTRPADNSSSIIPVDPLKSWYTVNIGEEGP